MTYCKCMDCKHCHPWVLGDEIVTCDAFPEGIPPKVGKEPHEKECANGIKWELGEEL